MKCLNPLICRKSESILSSVSKNKNKPIEILGSFLDYVKKCNIENEFELNHFMKLNNYFLIPCRKCVNCRRNRSREFAQRAIIESNNSDKNCMNIFLTLTYDDDFDDYYNPHMKSVNGIPTLYKKDLQDFLKRLRKSQVVFNDNQIRYLACGEYGSKTFRPHYHLILFNVVFPAQNVQLVSVKNGNAVYTNDYFVDLWKLGNISYSFSNDYTIKYICNYQLKSDKNFNFFNKLDIEKPFLTCSKGFGFDSKEFERQLSNNLNIFKFGDSVYESGIFEYYKNKVNRDNKSKFVDFYILNYDYKLDNIHISSDDYKSFITENSVNNKKIKSRKEL